MRRHRSEVEIDGVRYTIKDIQDITGTSRPAASSRMKKYKEGKYCKEQLLMHKDDNLISSVERKMESFDIDGEMMTRKDIARKTGLSHMGVYFRLKNYQMGLINKDQLLAESFSASEDSDVYKTPDWGYVV